jgi:lipid II:glycine glycyltransferase (peptidoglycan interpeptide bridge formation enzyme)
LETVVKKLHTDLKLSEECKASLVEKLRQSEALKNTALASLQHEVELLQKKVASLETLLHTERGLTSDYVTTGDTPEAAHTRDPLASCAQNRFLGSNPRRRKKK